MSDAESKTAGKVETKSGIKAGSKPTANPPVNAEAKPVDKTETKPVGKVENRQAGKGSKRRPFNAKQFRANYDSIHWNKGQSQRPWHRGPGKSAGVIDGPAAGCSAEYWRNDYS